MDMEVGELWKLVNERINWFIAGASGLGLLNVGMFLILTWNFIGGVDFFSRHQLQPTSLIVAKQNRLEEIPDMEEIKIQDTEKGAPFPERYADLGKSDLFIPLADRETDQLAEETTTEPEEDKPAIQGFAMLGRIYGKGDEKVTVLREKSSGKTYVAREGEFLENTDIKVEKITKHLVRLNQPGHRATEFRFKTDEISKKVREFVDYH